MEGRGPERHCRPAVVRACEPGRAAEDLLALALETVLSVSSGESNDPAAERRLPKVSAVAPSTMQGGCP